jgi:DNA-binding NarL/FixJ family response regulator
MSPEKSLLVDDNALGSGAHGYLLKNMRQNELFERLERALRGEAVIAPSIAQPNLPHPVVSQGVHPH